MTLCIDHDNKTAFVANEMKEQTYRYRVGGYDMNIREAKKIKKCTHEHVSRGICLYCGEEGVE